MSSKNFYGLTGDVTIDGGILNVANTNVSGNVTSTSLFVSNVATLGTTKTFVVTVGGNGKYHIDDVDRPLIELHEGQTYIFDITVSNAGGHPFKISQTQESGEYTNGVDDSVTNYIKFTVPFGAPTTLYYYCTQHSGMGATISISPESELIVSGRIVASGNVEASKITASANVEVTGNVVASKFVGDGSLLTSVTAATTSGLQVVTDNSPTTTNTIEFTNPTTSLRASSNIVATGNVTADHFIGDGSQLSGIVTSVTFGDAVDTGNVSSNTLLLTNAKEGLVATGNVVTQGKFIGDGSELTGIVTSVNLSDAVDTGNTTSNTVQFTNTSTSLTASGNVEVTGNVIAGYFIGDGSQLTGLPSSGSGTSHWTKTAVTNELHYTAGSVGISNANPIHDLSIGSNLYVDDDATDGILRVTGNVVATHFVGDGSRLINLPAGGGSTNWTTSGTPVNKIYYPQNPGLTSVSVGIMNATPQHTLSVGSNLFVDDTGSNVLVVDGDITAESMFLGALGIKPSYPLETVTDAGNVTPHTISFTNPTLGFTTTSNVEIGGELVIGKGTLGGSNLEVGEANLFVNTELTRVGIATDQPEATLHVNGSLAVDGPLTFGTVNVAAQHGLEAITAVSNTTPLTIELQNADTSLVTTGNVEVGGNVITSKDLTVSGNVEVGGGVVSNVNLLSVSNVASIKVDSNVVAEYTGPHDRPLRKYPEVALTADAATASGYKGYKVTFSAQQDTSTRAAFRLFDHDTTDTNRWQSGSGTYNTSSPHAAILTNNLPRLTDVDGTNHDGQWVGLQLPVMIKLDHIKFTTYQAATRIYSPSNYVILGSNTGLDNSWNLLKEVTNQLYTTNKETVTVRVNATNKYKYYIWLIKNLGSTTGTSSSTVIVPELEYYGHEEGSGSLDTTLKTVYNVPATTGTQLEVYYDGQNYTSGTTVTDISPNTNNGTLGTGVGFDTTYKAFTFDGTDDYIEGAVTAETGAWSHSVAFWIKIDQIPSSSGMTVYQIKDSSLADNVDPVNSTSPHLVINSGTGYINYAFWGNPGNFLDDNGNQLVAQTGVWQHYVVQYDASNGGTNYTDRKIIINGNKEYYPAGGTATALSMVASNKLFIGCVANAGLNGIGSFFDGSIANFRIYNKILNADQVQELYDYQKDYFLGSKSQVTLYKGHLGVGVTEPSGQLELAGDERIQEYPPGPMSDYETLIPGHGVFCAYASSEYSSGSQARLAYNAFDKASGSTGLNDIWQSVDDLYNGGSGTNRPYTGSVRLAENLPKGHYLGLKMPYPVKITSFIMGAFFNSGYRGVGDGLIVGRNTNNPTWEVVHTLTNSFMAGVNGFNIASFGGVTLATTPSIPIDNTKYYDEYALVVTGTLGHTVVTVSEWRLFGTPGPTTLDKGSLSLTRSLDVPRVSRYDVDTETPRPEKLVVDYDTTVNSSPTDISGQGNHGTFNGTSEHYSAADKAFVFNGTDDLIRTTVPVTGNFAHSVSVWIKVDTVGDNTFFALGNETTVGTDLALKSSSIYTTASGFSFVFYGGDMTIPFSYSTGRWYHVVATRDTGGTFPNTQKFYIDGVDYSGSASWTNTTSTTLALPTTATLLIGKLLWATSDRFDGQISNFKLYNVALEPSEVKKLYNLGRTGRSMVISDTAVGIGKVPEAQLDVRGSINSDGIMTNKNYMFWATGPDTANTQNEFGTSNNVLADFSRIEFELGSGFDTSTKTYTIPCSGYWEFSYCILVRNINAGTHYVMGRWLINGSLYDRRTFVYFTGQGGGSQESDLIGKIVGYYTTGTTVAVRITQDSGDTDAYMKREYSHFYGKLLH